MFVNLNAHSHYCLMSSTLVVDDLIEFAKKHKQTHVAMVDVNVMYGVLEFYNKAKANGLVPVIGLQITYENQPLILIAKDYAGYKNLLKISSHVCANIPFNINDFISSLFIIVRNKDQAKFLKSNKDVYSSNSNATDVIAIQECFFENKSDVKLLKALLAIKNNQQLSDYDSNHDYDNLHMLTQEEAKKIFSAQALKNLEELINACRWQMPETNPINFIKYDQNKSSKTLLQSLCIDGLKKRLNSSHAPVEYIDRLTNELNVIDTMNYNDYFLVVQDYVNYAKRNGILVGPGRGSAAGSLVAYVLGITDVDPIKYNLIFERFLNVERTSMPDIDIDFMDNRRNEVIEYIFNKYSKDRVAHIVTFQRMKAKMAIRDVGRILNIDLQVINSISKLIGLDYDLDVTGAIKNNESLKKYASMYPELFEIASKFINFPRQVGLHAAGIVITNTSLDEVVPIQNSTDGMNSTQYSMEYLEPIGLIKMDVLGLINLTTISETLKLIRTNHGKQINLDTLNLHDQKIFKSLASGDTTGIFQLESVGMTNLIMKINPASIEDISITSALFRPGPQKNIPTYLDNKAHPNAIKYLNDDFKHVLSSTYNIIIYQEQVIEIVKRVTKFSLAQSDVFRRAISKKDGEKLGALQKQFVKAALNNGYSESEANKIYDFIYEFANYGFNHSHSIAYSYISYWTAYLKYYYPLEYYCVLMSSVGNSVDKIAEYVSVARAHKIDILPPNLNTSLYEFSIKNKAVIFGFSAIKGIGSETINKLMVIRNNQPKKQFSNYLQAITALANNAIGIKTVETLIKAGCFDDLLKDKSREYLLVNIEEIYSKSKTTLKSGEMLIKPILQEIKENKNKARELANEQFQLLGINFAQHPLTKIKSEYKGDKKIVDLIQAKNNDVSHCLVQLDSYKEIKTKTGQPMAFVKIEDDTSICDTAMFSGVYEKSKSILKNNNVYIITLKSSSRGLQVLGIKEI